MRLAVSATSVKVVGGKVYVTISDVEGICRVSMLKSGRIEDVVSLRGTPCIILWGSSEGLLVSAGETLYYVFGNETRNVLKAKPGNLFWHSVEAGDKIFVQEYGEPPTSIYKSEDLRDFKKVVTNKDIDPLSRHFHCIAYDEEREALIVALGDGNIVRAAISNNYGSSWKPLYKGPWQFVPILIEGDKWIFGFDSGIARGGIGIYDVERGRWRFEFLRSVKHRFSQFMSLVKFDKYYIGCLCSPATIVVSENLTYWYQLYINNFTAGERYCHVEIWGEKIVAVTGKELLSFSLRDIEKALEEKPLLTPYKAYLDRAKGFAFTVKRAWWMLKL